MMSAAKTWGRAAVRYRWFVGFGGIWLGIVTTVTPALAPIDDLLPAGRRAVADVRGTMGAVSAPTSAAADAIPRATGFDLTADSGVDDSSFDDSSFDEVPSFDGFDSSGDEPEPEPDAEEPASEPDPPPAACTTDSSLPAPVVTTIVGAIADAQRQVTGATGQTLPADPAGTIGPALGCNGTSSGSSAEAEAPSLSNGVAAGGLTTADILRILFGW
jgi:hypothetical protein